MEDIVLVGGGGHCKSVIDVIEREGRFRIAGLVDLPGKLGMKVLDYPFFATDEDLPRLAGSFRNFIITLGQIGLPGRRFELFDVLLKYGVRLPVIVSPYACVSAHARLGQGTIVMHGAIVNAGAVVGQNCIINSRALIEHDALIGDHCHVATGAIINGGVVAGKNCFIGSGAVTKQGVTIPDGTFLKANSLYSQ
jgi:sugar O-acyltransferase (sialic acid O-acetyltransferase NeuD family)